MCVSPAVPRKCGLLGFSSPPRESCPQNSFRSGHLRGHFLEKRTSERCNWSRAIGRTSETWLCRRHPCRGRTVRGFYRKAPPNQRKRDGRRVPQRLVNTKLLWARRTSQQQRNAHHCSFLDWTTSF